MPSSRSRATEFLRQRAQSINVQPKLLRGAEPVAEEHLKDRLQERLAAELNTYTYKQPRKARWIWLLTGLFGGHRFHLERIGTGVLMALSGGGFLIWWIVDGIRLQTMVEAFNQEQARREAADEPAIGLEFIPMANANLIDTYPPWHTEKLLTKSAFRRRSGLMGDTFALSIFAVALGATAASQNLYGPLLAAFIILIVLNIVDRLLPYYHLPVIHEIVHWDYKLRLFYYFNKPGRTFGLLFRPIYGLFVAPFRAKSRAEVRLYAEIGALFVSVFILLDLLDGTYLNLLRTEGAGGFIDAWVGGVIKAFFVTYAYTSPIGAILTKHTLLRQSRRARWMLSGTALLFLMFGLDVL